MTQSLIKILTTGAVLASTVITPIAVSAQTVNPTTAGAPAQHAWAADQHGKKGFGRGPNKGMMKNVVMGTVSAISGNSITLTGSNNTTYTVDATSAKFMGGSFGSTQTLSNVQVGDKLMVNGTITGTSVAAKTINDISLQQRTVFSGKVTAVNGTTITMTGRNNTTYTVDASAAKLTKGFGKNAATISAGSMAVGDMVMIGGSLNGTSITATAINDMGAPRAVPAGGRGTHVTRGNQQGLRGNMHMGTVTAVNGTAITITGRNKTTYTVDASAAKLTKGFGKNATTITVSSITVGDTIMANGTLTGTSIAATTVNDMGTPSAQASTHGFPFFGGLKK